MLILFLELHCEVLSLTSVQSLNCTVYTLYSLRNVQGEKCTVYRLDSTQCTGWTVHKK